MSNLLKQIKKIIKENYIFLSIIIILLLLFYIPLPYYIIMPGGIIDTNDRIIYEDKQDLMGSLNMVYVLEMDASIPLYLIALINNDWDIVKKVEANSNLNEKEADFRSDIFLEETNSNALINAYTLAGIDYEITNEKLFVTYVFDEAITDLKVGDQILEVNEVIVNNKEEFKEEMLKYDNGSNLKIKTSNGIKNATVIEVSNEKIIGIEVAITKDIISDYDIEFDFAKTESGSSGGLMMTLALYNVLVSDLTNDLNILGTGSIAIDGSILAIGGIEYKIKTAVLEGADVFFIPYDNKEEAEKVIKEEEVNLNVVYVKNVDEAINYLKR